MLLRELLHRDVDDLLDLVGWFLDKPVRKITCVLGGLVVLQGAISIVKGILTCFTSEVSMIVFLDILTNFFLNQN